MTFLELNVSAKPNADVRTQVLPEMCGLATRLGVDVIADLNGVKTQARPGDNPEAIFVNWEIADRATGPHRIAGQIYNSCTLPRCPTCRE